MSLRQEIVEDLKTIENDLGNPTFSFQGSNYNFIPSISEFKRNLETGGFQLIRLITATVRMYDYCDETYTPLFNIMPTAQNIIQYSLDGTSYRIESIKLDPTNSYFRLIGHSTVKGL